MDRREFLKRTGVAGAASALPRGAQRTTSPPSDRDAWIAILRRLADPVLNHAANGTLKAKMPVEQAAGADRRSVTHLEAVGRLIAGLAPWIELPADDPSTSSGSPRAESRGDTAEGRLRARYADLARRAIAAAVDPASPDFLNFTRDRQPLVDAAFLAQGLLRAPRTLRDRLSATTTRQLVAALESTRAIVPGFNNWLLFSAMVEAGLKSLGASWDRSRVDLALGQHDQWYKGDGAYGDGPDFHWDYYNSFVIHPMLVDVLDACADESPAWRDLAGREQARATRYAAVQERLIAPDGSFPPIGRSIAYRCGAFHALAQAAFRRRLPDGIAPSQVRAALTAVIRRSMEAPDTFDADGWLRTGLCGHQPGIGETYISTGSLYLSAVAFLPLGLPASDDFWSAAPQPWTSARAWSGHPFPIDHALATEQRAAVQVGYCTTLANIDAAKAAGFAYVELSTTEIAGLSNEDFDRAAARIRQVGMAVPATNLFLPATLKVTGPDVDAAQQITYVRHAFDRLARLGTEIVVFGSGGARRVPEEFPKEDAFQQLVEFGRRAASEARAHGITIAIEPLRHEETNIINSAAEGLRLVNAIDDPNFQLMVDFYHLASEKEDPDIIVRAAGHIRHLHMANPTGRVFPRAWDEYDYGAFFAALKRIGYDKRISVEASTRDLSVDAPQAIALLQRAFQ